MVKRKANKTELAPYWLNPDISVFYELDFNKEKLVPGTKFRVKNSRGIFIFHKLVHNTKLDKTWIDCMDSATGEYRSFYVDRLKAVVNLKRSRNYK